MESNSSSGLGFFVNQCRKINGRLGLWLVNWWTCLSRYRETGGLIFLKVGMVMRVESKWMAWAGPVQYS
jgi:hypothetical protein